MVKFSFDLPHGPPRVMPGTATEIILELNGEPDTLWCELFSDAEVALPADDDVSEAVIDVSADTSGLVHISVAPMLPDGVIVRVLDWIRYVAEATNLRREALQRDAERVEQLANRWADQQIV